MALEIPTYQEIILRVESDIRQKLTENNPSADLDRFTNTIIGIFGTAMAGMIYLGYRLIAFASREVFVSQASADALVRHGNEIGILRNLATRSSYRFTISGVASTPVPSGTQFVFNLSQIYRTISSGLIQSNGELVTDFESVETGVATNLSVNDELTIQTPVLGINEIAMVSEILIEASNDESVASYRQRIIQRRRAVILGGSLEEWESWALEVSGITRAFSYRQDQGAGTVGVMVVADGSSPPIPTAQKILEVYNNLIGADRPKAPEVFVFGPTVILVNFIITLAAAIDNQANRNFTISTLRDLFLREGNPSSLILEQQWIALLTNVGITISSIESEIDNEEIDQVQTGSKEIAILGVVSFP